MSLITDHWSATGPTRINDYHVEFGAINGISTELNKQFGVITDASKIDFVHLKSLFNVWKNTPFDTATDYGTWHLNHDPRDNSPNIEIGALTMGGESVQTTGPWGNFPYTYVHSWMHAALNARVCKLKNIDPLGSFNSNSLQHGPQYNISTHAERAYQTPNPPIDDVNHRGYAIYSGDSDLRWDIAARDVSDAHKLGNFDSALTELKANANWLRKQTKSILDLGITDFWGLDK